ncbi:MAG: hypothetical protein EZS28_018770 [Streblomastix strix]|uniref:Uncharacterized protein n=1 Tax=Streblomastix strix TaxID=222440 RepID=A0A5J4VTT1_9EUKA|nr:MAG: hypothetical protein EZS28_018770 [Streblomastix strix]
MQKVSEEQHKLLCFEGDSNQDYYYYYQAEEDQDDCINQQLDEYGCYAVIVVVIELYVDEDEQEDEQEDGDEDEDVYFGGDLVCQGVKTVDKIFVGFRGVGDQRFSFLGGDQIVGETRLTYYNGGEEACL